MSINIVTGAPCSGKSTFVDKERAEGDIVVDYDKLSLALGSNKSHAAVGHIKSAAFKARQAAIDYAIDNPDAGSWVIHTSPKPGDLERYKTAGAVFHHLDATQDECTTRAAESGRPAETFEAIERYFTTEKRSGRGKAMQHKQISLALTGVKFANTDPNVFEGYASVFGGVDSYGDTIEPGAYAKTLDARDRPIQLRWNHFGDVIGKWTEIREDEKGLFVKGELTPGHSKATDVAALLKHGAVSGLSIGYAVKDFEQRGVLRVLKEIELYEISVVEEPADNAARVSGVKAALEDATALKEIESILRDAGRFSKTDATTIISRVKSLTRRDAEADQVKDLFGKLYKNLRI